MNKFFLPFCLRGKSIKPDKSFRHHSRLRHAKVEGKRNVAGADEIAAAAFDAIGQAVGAHLPLVVGARIPENLLRQQLYRADRGTITASYAGQLGSR